MNAMQKLLPAVSAFKDYFKASIYAFSVDLSRLQQIGRKEKSGDRLSAAEWKEARRIKSDIRKFVPYIMFLAIPGAGLVFLPYVLLFPDFVPTSFLKPGSWESRQRSSIDSKMSAREFLQSKNTKSRVEKLAAEGKLISELSVDELAALAAFFQVKMTYDPFWAPRTLFWLKSKFVAQEDTFKPWGCSTQQNGHQRLRKYALIKALRNHFSQLREEQCVDQTGKRPSNQVVSEESLAGVVASHWSQVGAK